MRSKVAMNEVRFISREEAISARLGKFYTGVPRKHGHLAERYIGDRAGGSCAKCISERFKARYNSDSSFRDKAKERTRRRWATDEEFRARQTAAKNRKRGMPKPVRPQPWACEMCGRIAGEKALHLDHCHETGKFRGWLCSQCNTGLGLLGDSIARLNAAVVYLEKTYAV